MELNTMTVSMCPKTDKPCEMASWSADHLRAQYVVPKAITEAAVPFILMSVMRCDGIESECNPAGPEMLDDAVNAYNALLREAREQETA